MIKRTEIFWGIALIISAFIFWMSECAKADETYVIPGLQGGINRAFDGTNLQPDQAFDLVNLIFLPNALQVREGFSYLNATSIGEPVTHISQYEPYPDTVRLVIVDSSGYVYVFNDLDDPGAGIDTFKISIYAIDGDSLKEIPIAGDDTMMVVGPVGNSWLRLYTQIGDVVQPFPDSTLSEITNMHFGLTGEDTLFAEGDFVASSGSDRFDYRIFRKLTGEAYTRQFQDKLYICDSEGFTVVFDDTVWQFLAVVDSGIIEDTISTGTAIEAPSFNKVHIDGGTNKVISDKDAYLDSHDKKIVDPADTLVAPVSDITWRPSKGFKVGSRFIYYYRFHPGKKSSLYVTGRDRGIFASTITKVDSINNVLEVEDTFLPAGWGLDYWNDYAVREFYYECGLGGQEVIIDSSKNWLDVILGSEFLSTFYHTETIRRFDDRDIISCNGEHSFTFPTALANPDHRYIIYPKFPWKFTQAPDDTAEVIQEAPRFSVVDFYLNQLYGVGFDREFGNDKDNVYRVWYSGISIPSYIVYNYNFDVDRTETTTNLFSFGDNLYIATRNSIWRSSGFPLLREASNFEGRGTTRSYTRITQRNGMPDWDNYAQADESYGYFSNRSGTYRMTNDGPQKISLFVDPLIEDNYGSEIVMAYQNPILYISFPDSNFTLIYDERYDGPFTRFDFGMTAIYAPLDTNIIYFAHSEHPGRVYYYPNGEYWDRSSPTDSSAIDIVYESGHQSLTEKPWTSKRLTTGYFPIDSDTSFHVDIFTDFSASASDTFTSATYGSRVYRIDNLSGVGDYFKTKITASVIDTFIIRPYWLAYQEADMKEGD